ncbi:MAG TPA: cytochrome C [Geomonas sp.]
MTRNIFKYSAVVGSLLAMALVAGCGTSNKEGNITVGNVAKVDESLCAQCHGSAREKLTGRLIYEDYKDSVHARNSVGCQDCHGGGAQHNGVGPIPFPKPGAEQCRVCHDKELLVTKYTGSKHALVQIENEEGQACQRCHTHQGAVLAAQFGFTGDGTVMAAMVNAPGVIPSPEAIKCNTCHVTHKPQELRVDAAWNPAVVAGTPSTPGTNAGNDQYRLCTQCHTYLNPAGKVAGSGSTTSGTVTVGHHETSWYRAIATTHYNSPTDPTAVTGYGVRTAGAAPCFDCHNHESRTNSNNDPASASFLPANTTIYTDWAQSGHAGSILTAKFAAAKANPVDSTLARTDPIRVAQGLAQVDAVMNAKADFPVETGASCVRCHTSTGLSQFLANPALGGSVTISGTTTTTVASTLPAGTAELIACWGCHSNPATGVLNKLNGASASTDYKTAKGHVPTAYQIAAGKNNWFPDVAGSNICISCHDGRNSDPASVEVAVALDVATGGVAKASTAGSHHASAAAVMYLKQGFFNLSTGKAYTDSLKSDLDGGKVTSTHRKLGTPAINGDGHNPTFFVAGNLDSNGPCVTCHMTGSHSLKIDQKAITAVCNKCHSSEGGNDITTIAAFDQHFIEPQSEVFQDALTLAAAVFNSRQSTVVMARSTSGEMSVYSMVTSGTKLGYTPDNYAAYLAGTASLNSATAADWTTVASAAPYTNKTKVLGAVSNILFLSKDKGAYAHARTYSRRLIFDSIDFLDDGSMNGSSALAAVATSPAVYGKGATAYTDGKLTTLAAGTTEAMIYLAAWSRSTGAWVDVARP